MGRTGGANSKFIAPCIGVLVLTFVCNMENSGTRGARSRSKSPKNGKISSRIKHMDKEQLVEALKKKKECNTKAKTVVEQCLEETVEADDFIEKIKDINQCHYEDIVEERSIIKLCGYPLCDKELTDIPNKKYHISTSTNKVYDITLRKKFCSNGCFKASEYIKEQMLTSPLWLRDQEIIPEFKLLDLNS